jgi:hydrogenase maturation protease
MQHAEQRVLVAGVGNLFLGDDGFGPEVARRLGSADLPSGVRVADYGIRGLHLALDLLDGWDALVLIDAIGSRGAPGTVHLIEVPPQVPDGPAPDAQARDGAAFEAHGMEPAAMLAGVLALGGQLPQTYILGCEAASVEEGVGLSDAVADAVGPACAAVLGLVSRLAAGGSAAERSARSEVS